MFDDDEYCDMQLYRLARVGEDRPARNVIDAFVAAPAFNVHPRASLEKLMPSQGQNEELFKLPEIPKGVWDAALKYGNRLAGLSNGRKHITFDFED